MCVVVVGGGGGGVNVRLPDKHCFESVLEFRHLTSGATAFSEDGEPGRSVTEIVRFIAMLRARDG